MHKLVLFLKDTSGATAIEYGLIAAGITGRDHRRRADHRHQPARDVQ